MTDIRNPQAEGALSGAGKGFSFFGGREEKYQNAADLFIEAANAFKMQRQCRSHDVNNCLAGDPAR